MKRIITKVLIVILLWGKAALAASAAGTVENVHVAEPGQLEDLICDLESSRISHLTITGTLNAADLIYLRSGAGRMAKIETLDISGIQLQASDEPYCNLHTDAAPYNSLRYYIADKDSVATGYDESPGWIVHDTSYREVYGKRLEGLFIGVNSFTHLILPSCMNAADYNFADNTAVETIQFATAPAQVGAGTFYQCTALKSVNLSPNTDIIGENSFNGTAIESLGDCAPSVIGDCAFKGSALKTLNSDRIKEIGKEALSGCQLTGILNLENITEIPAYVAYRTAITGVKFSPELKSIDREAFYACTNLTDVTLPESLQFIGQQAFNGVPFMTELLKGPHTNGVYYLGNIAYQIDNDWANTNNELSFKEGTTGISDEFARYKNFIKVNFPSTLKRIGANAFYHCEQLQAANLPEGLERIDDEAFQACTVLEIDSWPESMKYIGSYAFDGCDNIYEVTLPENLEYVGERAFGGKSISTVRLNAPRLEGKYISIPNDGSGGISRLVIGPKVRYLSNVFSSSNLRKVESLAREDDVPFEMEENCFNGNSSLKSVTLPQTTTSLPAGCFRDCNNLTSATFIAPNTSNNFTIGEAAFEQCTSLSAFELPVSTEAIDSKAFNQCISLSNITLPDGLKSIGSRAFAETALTSINWPSQLETIGGGAFAGSLDGFDFTFPSALKNLNTENEGSFYSISALANMLVKSIVVPAKWADQEVDFGDCINLETITFEQGAEKINCNVNNTKLKNLYIPDGVKAFESYITIGENSEGIETVSFPAECTRVTGTIGGSTGNYFQGNIKKLEWRIPKNYTYTGSTEGNIIQGFSKNSISSDIVIPEGVEELGKRAFAENYFNKIELPSTIKRIESEAFYESALTVIICHAVEPVTIVREDNPDYPYLWNKTNPRYGQIYVPAQSVEAYKASECWKYFDVYPMTPDMVNSIKDVNAGQNDFAATEVYNLDGVKVAGSTDNLPAGIYIVRKGSKTSKIVVQ